MAKSLKKAIAVLLSVLMIATALPFTAFAADNEHFLFAYFTGNDSATSGSAISQAIRFATSEDGINFTPLNDNKPVITQNGGTKNVRDPYIFKGIDGIYYLIGTDLDASTMGFWGNQPQMVIWKSTDLLNWTDETYINTAQICGLNDNQVQRTWAPEVIYDSETNKYMVYFAFAADGYQSTTMYYMLTDDLMDQSHYSKPESLFNPGADNIDADIVEQNGTFYMFYKDETEGRKTVCLATATESVTGPYTFVGTFATSSTTGAIEGCEVYTIGNDYYLVADRFGDNGKFAIYNLGDDLSKLTTKGDSISVDDSNPVKTVNATTGFQNLSARHGSVMHITEAQYNALNDAYADDDSDVKDNMVARFLVDDMDGLTTNGTVDWQANGCKDVLGAANFSGNGYLYTDELNEVLKNNGVTDSFSVSFMGYANSGTNAQYSRFFDMNSAGHDIGSLTWEGGRNTTTYIEMYSASDVIEASTTRDGGGHATAGPAASTTNKWCQFTVTVSNKTMRLFKDGILVATLSIGANDTIANRLVNQDSFLMLGAECWPDNVTMIGKMRDFRIYNKALSSTQATMVYNDYMDIESKAVESVIDENTANNASVQSFNANAYHTDRTATNGFSNVAYHTTWQTAWSGPASRTDATINIRNINYKIAMPTNIVLVYDGINDVAYPTVVETKVSTKASCRVKTIFPYSDVVEYRDYWKGYTTDWQAFNTAVTNETIGYAAGIDHETAQQDNTGTSRFWYNKLYYKGTGNTTDYYDHIYNLDFDVYAKKNSESYSYNTLYSAGSAYVLNYKPIRDLVSGTETATNPVNNETKSYKDMYASVYANKDNYTAESVNAYLMAAYEVASIDINGAFNGIAPEAVDGTVKSVAGDMKTAYSDYNAAVQNLECAHITTTVEDAVTPDFKHAGYTGDTYCDFCGTKVATGKAINPTTPDMEAYNDVLVTVDTLVESAYTPESWTNLQTAITNAATKVEDALVQKDIDDATAMIQTAINNLELATTELTVKVNVEVDGEVAGTQTYTAEYGDTVSIDVTDTLNGASIQKWTIEQGGATSKLSMASPVYDMVVTANATVTIIATANKTEEDPSYTKVKFTDRGYKTIGYGYVANTTDIDVTNIKPLADGSIVAPSIAFYNFTGWEMVAKNVYVATYAVAAVDLYEVEAGSANIKVNGVDKEYIDYDENIVITYTGDKMLGMYVDGKIIPITDISNVHAPYGANDVNVKIVEIEESQLTPTSMITGKYTREGDAGKTITAFNAMYYLPEGCTLVECGVYAKKSESFTVDTLNTATKVRSQTQSSNHEYTISMKSNYAASGVTKVYGMSYVTYKTAGGEIVTAYSDVSVINLV